MQVKSSLGSEPKVTLAICQYMHKKMLQSEGQILLTLNTSQFRVLGCQDVQFLLIWSELPNNFMSKMFV